MIAQTWPSIGPEAMSGKDNIADFDGAKICIVSRCAQTLYVFRRKIMVDFQSHRAQVVAMGADGDGYEARVKSTGAQYESVPISFRGLNPLHDLRTLWQLYRLFRQHRPQGVQLYTIKPVIYGALAARLAHVPAVTAMITGLGHIFTSPRPILRRIGMTLYRIALRHVDLVYFQNATDEQLFISEGLVPAHKTRRINGSGVDVEEFSPRVSEDRPSAGLHFLMIGRLIREKGVIEFLDAAKVIRARHPDAAFSLVGDTDPRNPTSLSLQEVERLAMHGGVRLLGHLADVRDAIASADVVVLPSYREGTPKSLLEAAAMGKAMLATDVPGCTEVVQHECNGLLFPAQSAQALADAMEQCITKPEKLAIYGANARAMAIHKFDIKLVNRQLINDMLLLMEQSTRRPKAGSQR
jgi:glycosyltransferase involved in cell wall biosynthesis